MVAKATIILVFEYLTLHPNILSLNVFMDLIIDLHYHHHCRTFIN